MGDNQTAQTAVRTNQTCKIWLTHWWLLNIIGKSNMVAHGAAATDGLTQVISCSMQGG